ncbi:hypothetical protein [Streptomyces sp. NPDC085529]|uniref:hypothetical protein n=1 Tax=Streptomyces sp. NPDC085529 TaxID=3365729 RepID=UPI0037D5F3C4
MGAILSGAGFLDGPRNKGQIQADAWKRDERMEEMAALKVSNPETFDRLSPTLRMSLGYYEQDKKVAAEHGRDVTNGGK